MGVILKNGIQYSGGDNSVVLTQSEYDALSDAEKRNGKTYYVKDGQGSTIDAYTKAETDALLDAKQDALVSGTNIKTVNGNSLLGAGNVPVGISIEVGVEKWYGTYKDENGVTYQVYTKTVYIPALPATAGITTYDHGVSNIKQILSIYGFTTDGFVLNAPRQTATDNIAIYQASKSESNKTFSIEVGKDRSGKKAYVTMIYAKNN